MSHQGYEPYAPMPSRMMLFECMACPPGERFLSLAWPEWVEHCLIHGTGVVVKRVLLTEDTVCTCTPGLEFKPNLMVKVCAACGKYCPL